MKKVCILLLLFAIPCFTSYPSNKTINASLGFGVATIGTALNSYIAYYFYKKYKTIHPDTTDSHLIAKRKQYAAVATFFVLSGILCLTGGTVYGITQLQPPSPHTLPSTEKSTMPASEQETQASSQEKQKNAQDPTILEQIATLANQVPTKPKPLKRNRGPKGRKLPKKFKKPQTTAELEAQQMEQVIATAAQVVNLRNEARQAFKKMPSPKPQSNHVASLDAFQELPANQQTQFIDALTTRLFNEQNRPLQSQLELAKINAKLNEYEQAKTCLLSVFQQMAITPEDIKTFQETESLPKRLK